MPRLTKKTPKKVGLPLLMEDLVNTEQRPKMEDFDDYVFVVLKMLSYNEKDNEIEVEQISLVLGTSASALPFWPSTAAC